MNTKPSPGTRSRSNPWLVFTAHCPGRLTNQDVEVRCEYQIVQHRPRKIKVRKIELVIDSITGREFVPVHRTSTLYYYAHLRRAILEFLS